MGFTQHPNSPPCPIPVDTTQPQKKKCSKSPNAPSHDFSSTKQELLKEIQQQVKIVIAVLLTPSYILNGWFPDLDLSIFAAFNFVFLVAIAWKGFCPPKSCFACLTFFLFPLSYSSSLQEQNSS